MFTYQIAPGSTDVSITLRVIDSVTGLPETGVDHATSGIDLKYRRTGSAAVDITEAALAALTTAHTDGGVEQIGAGYIRVDLPDAAVASGAAECLVYGNITDMVVIGALIQLEGYVNKIYSDTTIIYSDTTIVTSKATQLYSDTTIVVSDTTAIHTQTTTASSKSVQIYSDTTIIYSDTTRIHSDTTLLTAAGDGTAGAYPELGIFDQGTPQAIGSTTSTLRAAASFGADTLIGTIFAVHGSNQGYWQSVLITDNDASDGVTHSAFAVTPTGTLIYKIYGSPNGSGVLSTAQDSKLTRINSKATQVYSDTTLLVTNVASVYSDTTIIYSDTTRIHSDTTAIHSDTTAVHSDTTAIHTQTTAAASKAIQIYSDTTIIASKSVQIYSDTTAIAGAGGSLTVAQDSKLTRVNSKATQIYSDTTAISAAGGSLSVAQASQLVLAASKSVQIYSDTTIIYSDTTIANSKAVQIYSDTTIIASKATQLYSDTTAIHSDTTQIGTLANIADAIHDEVVDGSVTFRESVRLQNSALAGKASGLGTTTAVFRDLADTKARITATVDSDGNRSAVTRDAT
jgi:hypothetical protein